MSATTFSRAKDKIPFKLLEVNVISAHDLPPMSKMLRTYVVARVNADQILKTSVDHKGHTNPSWNHKMVFRVDENFVRRHSSAITFEIYNVAWLRDLPIGTSRLPIQNIFNCNSTTKPLALPICRPSGLLKGTVSVTVNIVDKAVESEAKHKKKGNLSPSLDEMIAAKFEPPKDLTNVQNFTLMLNDNDSKLTKKIPRKRCSSRSTYSGTLRPLPSDIVAGLNESSSVDSSPEHQSLAPSANFVNMSGMVGVDESSTKLNSKITIGWLLEKDNGKHKKKHYHHRNRKHPHGGGLLSCIAKGFEFTFACGGRGSSVKNNKTKMVGKGRSKADDFI
ncbi:C2 domain-containing protein [Heracleum sosnowskyi]|uniref:C2 domain-containing protein n=1 Tax=Heracleum sosnowskyi TaxID=360622 RepID=A0AAD8GYA9_9APIA|nr:C2 domain-containing protein [Heracleum sosnowskyi]